MSEGTSNKASTVCTICLADIDNEVCTTLKCFHKFHTKCYTRFLTHNVVHKKQFIHCPVCRDAIIHIETINPTYVQIVENTSREQGELDNTENTDVASCHVLASGIYKLGMLAGLCYVVYILLCCGLVSKRLCPT